MGSEISLQPSLLQAGKPQLSKTESPVPGELPHPPCCCSGTGLGCFQLPEGLSPIPVPQASLPRVFPCREGLRARQDPARGGCWFCAVPRAGGAAGAGIGFSSLRCSISLKRDSRDGFQMCLSSPPAGRGGCGELGDGKQSPEQLCRVRGGQGRIWPRFSWKSPAPPRSIPRGAGSLWGVVRHLPRACQALLSVTEAPGVPWGGVWLVPGVPPAQPRCHPGDVGRAPEVTGDVRMDWDR